MPHIDEEFAVLDPGDEQPQMQEINKDRVDDVDDMTQENFVDEGLFYDTQFMAGWAELR